MNTMSSLAAKKVKRRKFVSLSETEANSNSLCLNQNLVSYYKMFSFERNFNIIEIIFVFIYLSIYILNNNRWTHKSSWLKHV